MGKRKTPSTSNPAPAHRRVDPQGKHLKGWAKGNREDKVLRKHLNEWNKAAADKTNPDVLRQLHAAICIEYHRRVDWRSASAEEVDIADEYDPKAPPVEAEPLSAEELTKKNAIVDEVNGAIRRWFQSRVKVTRIEKGVKPSDVEKNPLLGIMLDLQGITKKPPRKTDPKLLLHSDPAIQMETRKRWQAHKTDNQLSDDKGFNMDFRNKVVRQIWDEYTDEQRKPYQERALTQHENAIKEWSAIANTSPEGPEFKARCQQNIVSVVGRFLELVNECTGMFGQAQFIGPVAEDGGKMGVIGVVTGKTQGKHGKLLHDYLGDRWVQVEKDLVEWGMHVFSTEDLAKDAGEEDGRPVKRQRTTSTLLNTSELADDAMDLSHQQSLTSPFQPANDAMNLVNPQDPFNTDSAPLSQAPLSTVSNGSNPTSTNLPPQTPTRRSTSSITISRHSLSPSSDSDEDTDLEDPERSREDQVMDWNKTPMGRRLRLRDSLVNGERTPNGKFVRDGRYLRNVYEWEREKNIARNAELLEKLEMRQAMEALQECMPPLRPSSEPQVSKKSRGPRQAGGASTGPPRQSARLSAGRARAIGDDPFSTEGSSPADSPSPLSRSLGDAPCLITANISSSAASPSSALDGPSDNNDDPTPVETAPTEAPDSTPMAIDGADDPTPAETVPAEVLAASEMSFDDDTNPTPAKGAAPPEGPDITTTPASPSSALDDPPAGSAMSVDSDTTRAKAAPEHAERPGFPEMACPPQGAKSSWFRLAWGVVTADGMLSGPLALEFRGLLAIWHTLEYMYGFKESPASVLLPLAGRPFEVRAWILASRMSPRRISNPSDFGQRVADWWWSMQPEWRKKRSKWMRGDYTTDWDVLKGDEGWNCLMVKGKNGMLTIVACLQWWGVAVQTGKVEEIDAWRNIVSDVIWVGEILEALIRDV